MKILLINTSERTGGAAVAANRLMRALRTIGIDVQMLVRDKQTDDPAVHTVNDTTRRRWLNRLRFLFERIVIFLCHRFSKKHLFQVSIANTGNDITQIDCFREADVIHLHWINQGFLSLTDLEKILRSGKPVVWTLHDLWPAAGICHYPDTCRKYQTECHHCPMQPHPLWDLAHQVFRRKKQMDWSRVHFVGCSQWITKQAQQSSLLRRATFYTIPNAIHTELFYPQSQEEVRHALGLPKDKKLILFGAAKVSDTRKGARYLIDACRLLKGHTDWAIILMGGCGEELKPLLPLPAYSLGYLSDPYQIASVYTAADVFIIPSLEDNLPNTIMEAMACGTPCVGFRTGGIPEMIDHQTNGYVASYKDAEDLALGITWVLDHPTHQLLADACIQKVRTHYTEAIVAKQYMKVYQELLTE